ncbi:DUF1854 domain-containing protein [Limnobacter sp.]|uniref:cyanophycin metabolism-associated DUF1854 family protein n=1 Tax=Limnobacter sp. TaxID=2003368 RepID=UPI003517E716
MTEWQLKETETGQLALYKSGELVAQPVSAVLAFPFTAPQEGISIVDEYSKELLWLDSLEPLCAESQAVLKAYLRRREYRPTIERITSVSTYNTPSMWTVETDQGPCRFELPSDESIRRLEGTRLVLTHANGMQFLIPDFMAMDRRSRQILARFMA